MKTVQSVEEVEITVAENDLLEGKWISFQLLSKKLGDIEKQKETPYKQLRNKLYNSKACGKYNTKTIAGFPCFDTENPMKGTASLVLKFKRG